MDEVYLLVRGLAQASVTMPTVSAPTLNRAVDIVLASLTVPDPTGPGEPFPRWLSVSARVPAVRP